MLKPVSPNSRLLYHTFLLGLKKKKNHPLPVPCQSCWGDPALGPKEGTVSSWGFVLVVTCAPFQPQVSTGGQGDPAGHSSLTCALHEEGCDQLVWQQPYFHCKSRIPRGTSDCGCLCRASAGRNLWTKCKAPESPFQSFHPGKRNQGG